MTFDEFQSSLAEQGPPADLAPALEALWWSATGEWDRAHEIVQDLGGTDAAWVHAHLHREEGDLGNASYWYAQAGQSVATKELRAEWYDIARVLVER